MGSGNRQMRTASQTASSPRGRPSVQQQKQKQTQQKPQSRLPSNTGGEQDHLHHSLPRKLQQAILDVFARAFPIISQQDDLKKVMQEVKGHLYNRDFRTAFSKQEYLTVYALRWSAARALAYTDIFSRPDRCEWFRPTNSVLQSTHAIERPLLTEHDSLAKVSASETYADGASYVNKADLTPSIGSLSITSQPGLGSAPMQGTIDTETHGKSSSHSRLKVVCIGGGAGAEIVALAAASQYLHSKCDDVSTRSNVANGAFVPPDVLNIHAVDIADWSEPVRSLSSVLATPPPLPSYASQATRDANRPLIDPSTDGEVTVSFSQQDVLSMSYDSLTPMLRDVSLVTIMFTLNELFSASLPKTTAFLLSLTGLVATGTYLVVVDSPGSYSEIQIGKTRQVENVQSVKKYPMKWLLDHTLLEVAGKDQEARWEKKEEEDSRWFRIDEKLGLRYAIDLENCRYQIHVFRKVK